MIIGTLESSNVLVYQRSAYFETLTSMSGADDYPIVDVRIYSEFSERPIYI